MTSIVIGGFASPFVTTAGLADTQILWPGCVHPVDVAITGILPADVLRHDVQISELAIADLAIQDLSTSNVNCSSTELVELSLSDEGC